MQCLFFQPSTIKVTFPRTVVVNKVVIVNVRATAQNHVRDHPCHPPHGRQRGSKEVEDHGHVPPGAQMAAAVVNKAVIVNVRTTAHDHLRDHPCHPPHGRQRGSEEEEDHDHVPPGAQMAAAVVNKAVIVKVRANPTITFAITLATPLTVERGGPKKRRITVTSPQAPKWQQLR